MGRIRHTVIKRTAAAVLEQNEDMPTEFSKIKGFLQNMNVFDSKKVRNKVAGYVVRIQQKKKF
ncbi:MAG: 30S ribosomal protein S17e [Candidatus Aenigmarchaeota archaeon]|nr:30S ribosomal protein S17e [Candidatus Aenigmarchaeota archaeon]MCK5321807.1 30S ribosomal protein S17e [Candidatus Aenigmarchaeota archaeon]